MSTPAERPDGELGPHGETWCAAHTRWECSKDSKRSHERCHNVRIKGRDACVNHVGESRELAKAKGEAALLAWSTQAAAGMPPLDTAQVVMDQLRLAVMRAGLYGELLRAQVEDSETGEHDVGGLVVKARRAGKSRRTEQIRALAVLEGIERDRAVKYAKTAHDMGVDDRHIEIAQEISDRVVASALVGLAAIPGLLPADRDAFIRAFLGSLGVDATALEEPA